MFGALARFRVAKDVKFVVQGKSIPFSARRARLEKLVVLMEGGEEGSAHLTTPQLLALADFAVDFYAMAVCDRPLFRRVIRAVIRHPRFLLASSEPTQADTHPHVLFHTWLARWAKASCKIMKHVPKEEAPFMCEAVAAAALRMQRLHDTLVTAAEILARCAHETERAAAPAVGAASPPRPDLGPVVDSLFRAEQDLASTRLVVPTAPGTAVGGRTLSLQSALDALCPTLSAWRSVVEPAALARDSNASISEDTCCAIVERCAPPRDPGQRAYPVADCLNAPPLPL